MNFEDSGDNNKNLSAADLAAQEVDTRNEAVSDAGDERLKAFQEELSGTTNRPERFGVGDNSRDAKSALERQSKSTSSFMAVASAQAYGQIVSFNVGGRSMSMSLGDLRNVSSDLRKHYGDKVRGGNATTKDQERMKAYDGLLNLIDDVAAGKASPDEINKHIQQHGLDEDVLTAASENSDIKLADAVQQKDAALEAGQHNGTQEQQQAASFDAIFGQS